MSVSFTDGDASEYADSHMLEKSRIGNVYIPLYTVEVDEDAGIRYEKHPWIEAFELDGIRPSSTCCAWRPPEI